MQMQEEPVKRFLLVCYSLFGINRMSEQIDRLKRKFPSRSERRQTKQLKQGLKALRKAHDTLDSPEAMRDK